MTKAEAGHPREILDLHKFVPDKYSLIGMPGAPLFPAFFLPPAPPSRFIGDFYDFFMSDFCEFDIGVSLSLSSTLSNDFSRKEIVKSILSIEAEYVKYG